MPLTCRARDFTLVPTLETGRFRRVLSTGGSNVGNWQFDNTELHPVVMALGCKRGLYWGDPAGTLGTNLYQAKNALSGTPGQWVGTAEDGLQPLIDAGRISQVSVYVDPIRVGVYGLRVDYHNQADQPQPPLRLAM